MVVFRVELLGSGARISRGFRGAVNYRFMRYFCVFDIAGISRDVAGISSPIKKSPREFCRYFAGISVVWSCDVSFPEHASECMDRTRVLGHAGPS